MSNIDIDNNSSMDRELDILTQRFALLTDDISSKKNEIRQIEDEIDSLSNKRSTDSNTKHSLRTSKETLENSYNDYSQYKENQIFLKQPRKNFIEMSNLLEKTEKKVLELEKKVLRNQDRIENGIYQIERENKRKEKIDESREKCDFFRQKKKDIIEENKRLKILLEEILSFSKKKEKLLCSDEADELIKAFNKEEKKKKEFGLQNLLVFRTTDEILEEQEELISQLDL